MAQPRRRDKTTKIAAILNTANTLFKKQGYAATTTNQIAAEAGVSIGLLYKYFPGGKPDIAWKAVEDMREMVFSEELGGATPENAPILLRRALLRFIKGHRRVSSNIAAFEMAVLEDAETAELGKHLFSIGSDSVTSILSKLTGRENSEKLQKWGSIVFHIVDSTTHRQVLHDGLSVSDEELAGALTRIIVAALTAIREE